MIRMSGMCLAMVVGFGCESAAPVESEERAEAPVVFDQFNDNVTVYALGDVVVLETDGVPDHGSPYFATNDSRYEAYSGVNQNFNLNPNRIATQNFVFRIPLSPSASAQPAATPLGPIGIAINGVAIFNQYAGPNQPLTNEIDSFDHYNGHPQNSGAYHYHIEPLHLTVTAGVESLIGFLLDGFPVYGPEENGQVITNADLDALHGHIGPTVEYPAGIYHYHITAEDPYINGNGFYGAAGVVSQ
jgi:hypothetical protein